MTNPRLLILLIFLLANWHYATVQTLPIDSVKPGMKGIGYSVFSGTKPERFEIEVIDVIHRSSPRGDLILARLAGAGLENTGVIAGMSGSPVYIDDKLLGAVAYAWPFAKEPIAGITPAGEMLKIWRLPQSRSASKINSTSPNERFSLHRPPVLLALSGLNSRLEQIINPVLTRHGFQPVASGKTLGDIDTADLVPGGAVGVALLDGDVRASAVGTITHRDSNRILAFGHPLFLAGAVRLPMTGGKIHTVLPSLEISFKIFSPTSPIGIINQDRATGISGIIGPSAPMIPVLLHLHSPNTTDTFRFRVADQEKLVPDFLSIGLVQVILESEGAVEDYTIESKMRLFFNVPTKRQTEIRHIFTSPDPVLTLFSKINSELNLLFNNPLEPVELKTVETELHFSEGRKTAQLLTARPERTKLKPGETLNIILRLRDYRDKESEKIIPLVIPPTTPAGALTITISSRDEFINNEMSRAGASAQPKSLDQLLQLLQESGREDELAIAAYIRKPGASLQLQELPRLPPSIRTILGATRSTGEVQLLELSRLFKKIVPMDRVVLGSATLELEVQ